MNIDYTIVLMMAVTYIAAIVFHELSHVLIFKINGLKIRMLALLGIIFLRDDDKIIIKYRPKSPLSFGGMAFANTPIITNDEEFKLYQNVYAKAMIAGPIGSIVLVSIMAIITLMTYIIAPNNSILTFDIITLILLSIITVLILFSSFVKNEIAVGDFAAYKLMKDDDNFASIMIYNYILFSEDSQNRLLKSKYLQNKVLTHLVNLDLNKIDIYSLSIIDTFIVMILSDMIDNTDEIKVILDKLKENPSILLEFKVKEPAISLMYHLVQYCYVIEKDEEMALMLYEPLKKQKPLTNNVQKYYTCQTEHLLRLDNHKEFLSNSKNIIVSQSYNIWNVFPSYYEIENKINSIE